MATVPISTTAPRTPVLSGIARTLGLINSVVTVMMDSVGLYAMNAKQAKATTMRQARVRPVRTRTSMMLLLTRLPVPHKSAPTVKALQATAHRGSQVVELLTALSVAPATIRLLERGSAQKTRVR